MYACAFECVLIGASVGEPLLSDVYVDFVMDRRTGVRHSNGACVSFFWTGRRTAWQRRMRLIFSHVAVYVTVVTLFRQSTHNTVTHLRKPIIARSEYL